MLEEEASPGEGGGAILTRHQYNNKGLRIKTSRTGTADMLMVYDDWGNLTMQGYDVDGNGALDRDGTDILTETVTGYELVNGTVVERTDRKEYKKDGGTEAIITTTRRTLGEGDYWQQTVNANGTSVINRSVTAAASHLHTEYVDDLPAGATTPASRANVY